MRLINNRYMLSQPGVIKLILLDADSHYPEQTHIVSLEKNMFGQLTAVEIEDFLANRFTGRIGCHAFGKTYVVPISYIYDNGFVYCHSHEGLKLKIMRENPHVCFETDIQESPETWKSVIAWGTFEELATRKERLRGFAVLLGEFFPFAGKALKKELGAHYPFLPDNLDEIRGTVFRICLTEKTGRFEVYDSVNQAAMG